MSQPLVTLTADQIRDARLLRIQHWGWARIGRELGVCGQTVRRALFPEWGKTRREWQQKHRDKAAKEREKEKSLDVYVDPDNRVQTIAIPSDVLFDRDRRRMLGPQSFTAWICGDPLPGYSALDKRQSNGQ